MPPFIYSRNLLEFLLDCYFSGRTVGENALQLVKIGGRNWGFEGMSAMKSDAARAVKVLDSKEKQIVALRHSGHTFYEIRGILGGRKSDAIDIYEGAVIKMLVFLNGPL